MPVNPRVFLSYSRKDGEGFAAKLRQRLETENIPLWQDRVGMQGGRDWWIQILEALDKVEFMVLVMTPEAMKSDIIRKEWRYARQNGVCVYPVKGVPDDKLDYAALPRWMGSAHFYDLDYEEDKFINDLNTRCQEPRVPFMVEDLPKNFVQRPEEFNTLIEQLLDAEKEEPLAITTALRGAGGYGKTTLAMALCHDEHVQDAYDDGILWVTLGEQPGDLTEKIKNLIEILSGERPGFTDKDSAAAHLSELLADRDILIVIDDAWDNSHIQPFLRGGTKCSRLITTRNSDTLPTGSKQNILDAMQVDEAQSLIGFGLPDTQKDDLAKLALRLGQWPLVLKLVNAFLFERVVNQKQDLARAISYVNKRLEKYGITAFDPHSYEDRRKAVEGTLSVSLEILSEEEQQRFAELVIFPEDIGIPLETVEKLWAHAGFDELDTEDLCERLFRLSLLQHFDPNTRVIRLHDVIRSYVRGKNKQQLNHMHENFLRAYDVEKWIDLPSSEPYLWKHLAYHLSDGQQVEGLHDLLCDFHWIRRKLAASDVNALLADYGYLVEDKDLLLIQSALRLSANQITLDQNQLTPHLVGRLKDQTSPEIEQLLQNAIEAQKTAWFCPIFCSLQPTGGPLLRTFEGYSGAINALAISTDGKTALYGSHDNTVKLRDLGTGQVLKTLVGHEDVVCSVALSDDGKTALSGSGDHTIKLWDLSGGQVLKTLLGHGGSVTAVAFSADGKTALSGSDDKTVKLWNLGAGQALKTLKGHNDQVCSVALSEDGKTALSGSFDKTIKLWDLGTDQVLKSLKEFTFWVFSVAFSVDGKLALTGSDDKTIKLWDLESGQVRKTLIGHLDGVSSVAFSADGKTALSGSWDTTLKLWDLGTGQALKTLEGHIDWVNAIAISADGKTALSGSPDKNFKLWDLKIDQETKTLEGHGGCINAVAISADGKTALSGSADNTLKQWDLDTAQGHRILEGHERPVNSVALSRDGKTAISGANDNTVKQWDLDTGRVVRTLRDHRAPINSVAISADGKTALSCSFDDPIKLWDLSTGQVLRILKGHDGGVNSVAISVDGKFALSGSSDKTVKYWDLGTGQVLNTLKDNDGWINSVALSAGGKTALSGSNDKTLKLWDLESGQVLKTLLGHDGPVNSVAFSTDGKFALSGSDDKTLKLWNLHIGIVKASFIGESVITSVAIASCGKIVLAGDTSGLLHFFRIEGGE